MNIRSLIVEFIGTFFLVLVIGLVVIDPGVPAGFAPVAIGFALTIMVFAGGHISGAHYNPAVTLSFVLRGKLALNDALGYWVVQLLAAIVAALLVGVFKPTMPASGLEIEVLPALLAEFLFTFALVYVIHNVATAKGTEGNSFYGLAIGMTVLAGAFAVGGISGGAFNPAVTVGGSIMNLFLWGNIWVYLLAQLTGAAVATYVFKITHPGE
jgi:aquaporin Z